MFQIIYNMCRVLYVFCSLFYNYFVHFLFSVPVCMCSMERSNEEKNFKIKREAPSMLQLLLESIGVLGNLDSANLGFLSLTSLRSAICIWSTLQCLFLKTSLFIEMPLICTRRTQEMHCPFGQTKRLMIMDV